jgi:transaldolase
MKLFIDSADIDEISLAYSYGIIDGITTNPSLIKQAVLIHKQKAKSIQPSDVTSHPTSIGEIIDMRTYIEKIFVVAKQSPVSLEVKGGTADEMYAQARSLYSKFKTKFNTVVIKIPINSQVEELGDFDEMQGIQVIKRLSSEGIPTNVTLIFTPEQALLAAKAGATYVSPFVGREDDFLRSQNHTPYDKNSFYEPTEKISDNGIISGVDLVKEIVELFEIHGLQTQVLAASLRNPRQVREAALCGAHVATVPLNVIKAMIRHPKTMEGMVAFTKDFVPEYDVLFK